MEIKKVAIIGLGALGILFGAQIVQKIGDDLTIIADQKRIKNYQNNGVFCNGMPCRFHYKTPEQAEKVDLIIFAVNLDSRPLITRLAAGYPSQHIALFVSPGSRLL